MKTSVNCGRWVRGARVSGEMGIAYDAMTDASSAAQKGNGTPRVREQHAKERGSAAAGFQRRRGHGGTASHAWELRA
jgi:hypothetical protein